MQGHVTGDCWASFQSLIIFQPLEHQKYCLRKTAKLLGMRQSCFSYQASPTTQVIDTKLPSDVST